MKDKTFSIGDRIYYKDYFEKFLNEYEDFKKWLKQRTFNQWIKAYFDFKGVVFTNESSNGNRFYELKSGKDLQQAEPDPFEQITEAPF